MAQAVTRGPVSGTATAVEGRRRKPFLIDFYSTAVGKKYVMAITGIIGIGFVIVHMVGNLKVYLGLITEDGERVYDIDVYGEFLRELLVPILPRTFALWLLRIVLIVRPRPPPPRRLLADGHEPPGPAGALPVATATTSSPTSPAARCAGPASSSCCSCSSTSPTSRGAGSTRTSSVARSTATSTPACPGSPWRSSTSSPTSPSASTCSTARGACSSRWGGTAHGSTPGGAAWPPPSPRSSSSATCSFPIAVQAGIVGV